MVLDYFSSLCPSCIHSLLSVYLFHLFLTRVVSFLNKINQYSGNFILFLAFLCGFFTVFAHKNIQ